MSITALATRFSISAVTVRRDLDFLDSVGLLTRTHGGAVAEVSSAESPYIEKIGQAKNEKLAIGRLAASLVRDGDVIVVGPGTTTEALAGFLRARSGLTVITNSLPVAAAFVSSPDNEVIMTGGSLRAPIRALVGETTNLTLRGLHADKTFISGNGLVAEFGLSTPNIAVADSDRAMAMASQEIIVLADHTKVGVRTAIRTVETDAMTHVITDVGAPSAEVDAFVARGVNVHVVTP